MMTFDGDTDRPKPRKPSASAFHGKDVPLSSLNKADVQHLAYLIDHHRVSASIRKLTREVVVPEGSIVDDLRVLHVEALYMREEKEEGRWIITHEQASELIKAGAYDADR